jgi:hypothetical protein
VILSLRLSRTELSPSRIETKCHRAFPPVTAGPIASPFHKDQIVRIGTDAMLQACVFSDQIVALGTHPAGFTFGQIGTDAAPPPCVYSGQIGASTPHQADFTFGRIGTDVTLQACAYSGQIGALRRIKRASPSVKSGPTPRSRRALTQAKSGPYAASSGLHLQSRR